MSPLTEGGNAQRKEATMLTGTILLLGAFAGLTIYLGLPLAFLKQTPRSLKVFLNMLATVPSSFYQSAPEGPCVHIWV